MVTGESGVALGVMEGLDYQTVVTQVGPGDTMLLYTDGVTEATDAHDALFDESRLIGVLGSLSGLDPADVIAHVQRAVEGFVGDAPQFDDITMLSLRFERRGVDQGGGEAATRRLMLTGFAARDPASPPPVEPASPSPVEPASPSPVEPPRPPPAAATVLAAPVVQLTPVTRPPMPALDVTIANDLAELQRLAELVDTFVARHGLPERMAFNLNLCLDELITNIVSYGYDDGGRHQIQVRFRIDNNALVTTIVDDAKAYDPFVEAPEPDLESEVDQRRVGGLGVFLVKEFNDLCEYRRDGDKNVVTMSKSIDREN